MPLSDLIGASHNRVIVAFRNQPSREGFLENRLPQRVRPAGLLVGRLQSYTTVHEDSIDERRNLKLLIDGRDGDGQSA